MRAQAHMRHVFSVSALIFLLPSHYPSFFFSFHCYHSVTGARMFLWGLMAGLRGLLAMGSVLLSRGWLVTVKVPGHTGHPPSTQLDAVVNLSFDVRMIFGHAFQTPQVTHVLSSPVKDVARLCS